MKPGSLTLQKFLGYPQFHKLSSQSRPMTDLVRKSCQKNVPPTITISDSALNVLPLIVALSSRSYFLSIFINFVWIWMDLDLDLDGFGWICIPSSVFCVVQPCRGLFFPEKTRPWCFCSLKQCFLHSTKTIFNGTRLDRRGLKS